MSLAFAIVVALLLGAGLSVQAGVNASLRSVLGHPLHSTIINFVVGLVLVLAYALLSGLRTPAAGQFGRAAPWMYLGGAIGAAYVTGVVVLAPRLGAATLATLVIAGQLAAALVIDHFGWLGFPTHPISPTRVAGVALVVAGVILVRRG
ncbi:MAG: DMT family transporter [Gemmatimonadetes bacterium]|nr:DMT family transporter [Gemmatimonadota bacterium]